jgi:hypothetical protein
VPDGPLLLTDEYGDGPVGRGPDRLVGAVPVPGDMVLLDGYGDGPLDNGPDTLEGAVPVGVLLGGKVYTPPVDVGKTGMEEDPRGDSVPGAVLED